LSRRFGLIRYLDNAIPALLSARQLPIDRLSGAQPEESGPNRNEDRNLPRVNVCFSGIDECNLATLGSCLVLEYDARIHSHDILRDLISGHNNCSDQLIFELIKTTPARHSESRQRPRDMTALDGHNYTATTLT